MTLKIELNTSKLTRSTWNENWTICVKQEAEDSELLVIDLLVSSADGIGANELDDQAAEEKD